MNPLAADRDQPLDDATVDDIKLAAPIHAVVGGSRDDGRDLRCSAGDHDRRHGSLLARLAQ
jgi:hypothetical protein